MTKEERQALILELLMQHDSILVTDLATHLNVSSVTIRKDLTDLEREKKLYRNHGKAILIDPYIDNRNVSEKEKLYVEEKRLIGMKAANLIAPKDSILIASGTTMHALARSIAPADELTVITASMEVSNILASEKTYASSSLAEFYGTAASPLWGNMRKTYWQTSRAANYSSVWTALTSTSASPPPI